MCDIRYEIEKQTKKKMPKNHKFCFSEIYLDKQKTFEPEKHLFYFILYFLQSFFHYLIIWLSLQYF